MYGGINRKGEMNHEFQRSRNRPGQFSDHRDFPSDRDQGRILFRSADLAGIPAGRNRDARRVAALREYNRFRIARRTLLHLLLEHSGNLRAARTGRKGLVSRRSLPPAAHRLPGTIIHAVDYPYGRYVRVKTRTA